jgi:hypothetical protein
MWPDKEMFRPLQNNVVAARRIKNQTIRLACAPKIICFAAEMLFTFYAVVLRKNG